MINLAKKRQLLVEEPIDDDKSVKEKATSSGIADDVNPSKKRQPLVEELTDGDKFAEEDMMASLNWL